MNMKHEKMIVRQVLHAHQVRACVRASSLLRTYHIDLSDIHGLKGIDQKIENEFLGRGFADHNACICATHGLCSFKPFLVDF